MEQIFTTNIDGPEDPHWKWDWAGVSGIALVAGGAAYSFVAAPRSAAEYNLAHAEGARVSVTPAFHPSDRSLGVRVGVRF